MAELDRRYYRGSDEYTDGDEAENRLLELARANVSLDDLAVEEVSWPVLYHMHPARENVCNWYPFRKGARILEIGSGCGAITGALCRLDCEVCSVELSLRRATINFERHRDCENLRIIVGNLNDVPFDEPFDYVLLIGVLEYAGKFTGGDDPYRQFLENIRKYLKPDGRLLIAIENRLGMKYFSGAPEDHLGTYFSGLNGYDPAAGVRTFSHSELEALLKRGGFAQSRFYYPYPDYKFPSEIFTDRSLETMHYGKYFFPLDQTRCAFFPEWEVAGLMAREGVAASVANSFFVEAAVVPMDDARRVVYVKQNSERDAACRIGTRIVEDSEGVLSVCKYAMTDAAEAHLDRILENERLLAESRDVLRGERTAEGISYPFVSDRTVDALLNELLQDGKRDEALRLIDDVLKLASISPMRANYDSDAFTAWFGTARTAGGEALCAQPANIDLILDNLFVRDGGYQMMDCEWVADFPVPVAFILWRALRNAYYQYPQLSQLMPEEEMFERCGIERENVGVYEAWSQHFEAEYVKNNGIARFGKGIRRIVFDPKKIDEYDRIEAELASTRENEARMLQTEALDKRHIRNLEGILESERALLREAEAREAHMHEVEALDKQHIRNLESANGEMSAQLRRIYDSRLWKLATKVNRLLGRNGG